MSENVNEKLAYRLADMLSMLYAGELLRIDELVEKYSVSKRTIQRDIARLEFLDLVYEQQGYRLNKNMLGMNLGFSDVYAFAQISGIEYLYPKLDYALLHEINTANIYDVKVADFEDSRMLERQMKTLKQAIQANYCVQFDYKQKSRQVEPYKLVHHLGCWYLAGVEQGQIKTYHISRMSHLVPTKIAFTQRENILREIEQDDSIWFGQQKIEVVIQVSTQVAQYFKQRQLLPKQNIVREMVDGTLLLSCQIGHKLQLFPIVRWWIPYLKIVSPSEWQDELESGLKFYLENKLE
ncbi:YafY family protein [Moraxella sp. ZY210820]|uniref:helix-turn-helix transcriptional regulator n=1 Tax=unclassified Moraxella TaxID=2685852 RepID=UPI0027301B3C|nr:WYL domain-containing protein [Moraxella sp. ZY210820]WLF83218.1 WYL domain-containing protein [Moraxella sp. ZY210820]